MAAKLDNLFSIPVSSCSTWDIAAYAVPAEISHMFNCCQYLSAQATCHCSMQCCVMLVCGCLRSNAFIDQGYLDTTPITTKSSRKRAHSNSLSILSCGTLQDLEHCGTVRTGSAWLTAATATPVSYNLCTASYARTINIYELQVNNLCSSCAGILHDAFQA